MTFRTDRIPPAAWTETVSGGGSRYRQACRRTQAQVTARATDAAASVNVALNAVALLARIDGHQEGHIEEDLQHVQIVLQRILKVCCDSEASLVAAASTEPPAAGLIGRAS